MEGSTNIRIVATSDVHFPIPARLIPDGDVLILAGDFMYDGTPAEWYKRVEALEALPHKIKLFVAGNHDFHLERYAGVALQELRKAGVHVIGPPTKSSWYKLENGMTVLGLPFVTNLDNWAFNRTEEQLDEYLAYQGRADIVISHSPPKGILDGPGYGAQAYRGYLLRCQPKIWICGHVHTDYGTHYQDGCEFHNVALCNEAYQQVNVPHIIDI